MSSELEIPDSWKVLSAENFCAKVADGTHASPKRTEQGKPLVTSKNIIGGSLDLSSCYNISMDDFLEINKRSKVDTNDVLLSMIGTVGESCFIDKEPDFAIKNVGLLKNNNKVDGLYLHFYLMSPTAQKLIGERLRGTTQQYLPLGEIRKFPIPCPEEEYEKSAIVDYLSILRDKINLISQINKMLESIAQALFQSWFVDFDPVKAKLAAKRHGRDPERAAMAAISGKLSIPPGKPKPETLDDQLPSPEDLDAAIAVLDELSDEQRDSLARTASLFPNDFEENELGLIPAGWVAKDVSALCKLNAKNWSNKNHPDLIEYIDLANTKNGSIDSPVFYEWKDAPSRARRVLAEGDTIIGVVRPGNRSFSFISSREAQYTASTGFAVLTPISTEYKEFIYLCTTDAVNIDRLANLADGAAYPAVRPSEVVNFKIAVPDNHHLIGVFHEYVEPYFQLSANNKLEANVLADLRDTLLPKLLSGEIRVPVEQQEAVSA